MSKAITFKTKSGEKVYTSPYMPIGSIYLSVNSTNPSTYFGGTWSQIKDRFLLCCGNTYSAGSTGGEATHKLTISEMPSHSHAIKSGYGDIDSEQYDSYRYQYWGHSSNAWKTGNLGTNSIGGNTAHNNMPPYLAVYVWKRIS